MPRYLACHTVPGVTQQMLEQVAKAAQQEPRIKAINSYTSLSEGVVHCVFDAPSTDALASWFKKMKLPYDRITAVELEG